MFSFKQSGMLKPMMQRKIGHALARKIGIEPGVYVTLSNNGVAVPFNLRWIYHNIDKTPDQTVKFKEI